MAELSKVGVVTLIEELLADFHVMVKDLEPYLNGRALDPGGLKQHLDDLLEKMGFLNEKSTLTHQLIKGVISSIHSSRKELKQQVDGLIHQTEMQLKKITSTTEDATNKIMDVAMKLDGDQNIILDKLDEIKNQGISDETSAIIEDIKNIVYDNQNSAFDIIQFLQFQDITAQQIAGAYSLLNDTEKTLLYVLNLMKEFDFGDNDPATLFNMDHLDKNSFNAGATFGDKDDIQDMITELFKTGDTSIEIPTDEVTVTSSISKIVEGGGGDDEEIDIDSLFGGNK